MQWNFAPSHDFNSDWRGYFAEYTAALREAKTDFTTKQTPDRIIVPRHNIDPAELPKPILDITKLVAGNWKAQHSQTWHEGAVYKSGPKEGQKRPDKTVDHYAIGLVSNNPLTAVWSDGKMQYAKGVLGGEMFWTDSVMQLKRKMKEEWHG